MKSKTIVAVIATLIAFTYISCQWFDKHHSTANNSIIGEWQVMNIADSSKDSSRNDIALLLTSVAIKDTLHVRFGEDSTALVFTNKESIDTARYNYDEANRSLFIVGKDKDSLIANVSLVSKDSLHLYLPKDSILYKLRKLD